MGMHGSCIAVPAAMDELVREFATVWPHYDVGQQATLASLDHWAAWKGEHERFVSAADWTLDHPGVEVLAFLQDGDWAVLLDTSHVLATDTEALARLSARFGRCLSFAIETAGGFASFAAFRQGQVERSIERMDGELRMQGEPLPEEAGLDLSRFYMDETEALQQRLGLRLFTSAPPSSVLGVAMTDRTDYSAQRPSSAPMLPEKTRPWWKLW